jgi:hypothetical protein
MTRDRIPRCAEAVAALLTFATEDGALAPKPVTTMSLFSAPQSEAHRPVDVELTFVTAPKPHRVPMYFQLPHEVLDGTVCVITNPPQRRYKDIVQRAAEEGDPIAQRIKKVSDTKKLSAKFSEPAAVRALAHSFDHFVAFQLRKFPAQLTGEFLSHQKHPVFVFDGPFMKAMNQAMRTAVCPRRGFSAVTIRIGHLGSTAGQLEDNVRSLLNQLTESREGVQWSDILSIRVAACRKDNVRAQLPIYAHAYDETHPGVLKVDQPMPTPPVVADTPPPQKKSTAKKVSREEMAGAEGGRKKKARRV